MNLYGILDLMAWAIVIYKQQYNTQPGQLIICQRCSQYWTCLEKRNKFLILDQKLHKVVINLLS